MTDRHQSAIVFVRITVSSRASYIFTERFNGSGTAISRVCVSVCARTIT